MHQPCSSDCLCTANMCMIPADLASLLTVESGFVMPPALIQVFCAQGTKGRAKAGARGRAEVALSASAGGMEDISRASVEIGLDDDDSGDSGEGRAGNADRGRAMHQGRAKRAGALSEDGELQVCSPTLQYHLMTDWVLVCIWHSAAVVLHISPSVGLCGVAGCVLVQLLQQLWGTPSWLS